MTHLVHVEFLIVADGFQGKGIAGNLVREGMRRARESEAEAMITETTGYFSARAFEKQGFKCVSEIMYNDYVDEKGEKILQNMAPHKSIKLMLLYL